MSEQFVLHEDPCSGNCYKIKLTAELVGVSLDLRQYDIIKGETRTPQFLATVNANGRIPVLEIQDGVQTRFLPESNAACWYLASGSSLIPRGRFAEADMLRWMFFEQYNHEPNVATMRFWMSILGETNLTDDQRALISGKRTAGQAALALMDQHLATHRFMCGEGVTLADIALFPYTHKADEGGFSLADYSSILAWIDRIKDLPDYIPMD